MSITDNFRKQHDDLLQLTTTLSSRMSTASLGEDASDVLKLLSQLGGKLRVHLAMEDKSLYPRFMSSGDPRLEALAQQFIDEMGGLAESVDGHLKRWNTPKTIQNDPNRFVAETTQMIQALGSRIQRENTQLYPAVE